MELEELMRFARAYSKLGWAIQEQLNDIVNGEHGDINPNALQEIDSRMRGFNDDLDEAIYAHWKRLPPETLFAWIKERPNRLRGLIKMNTTTATEPRPGERIRTWYCEDCKCEHRGSVLGGMAHEGDDEDGDPLLIPCSYPGCTNQTTRDPIYGDLCYRHIRADNE